MEILRSRLAGGGLVLMVLLPSVVVLAPLLGVLLAWLDPQPATWRYLLDTQLLDAIGNTLFLLVGVLLFSGVLGVGTAWLNTAFIYPGRSWLQYALVLPLALPVYVFAFAFLGLFGVGGSIQSQIQSWWPSYEQLDIRSSYTLIVVMGLALFPYVYLLVRNAFSSQGVDLFEVSRTLGLSPWQAFTRTVLPATRPVLVAALLLVGAETLAEFGAVSIFNYNALTTAIYKTWFGLLNFAAAAQIASLLLLFALLFVMSERALRGRAHYVDATRDAARLPHSLSGVPGMAAFALCFGVFALGFLLPLAQLAYWAWQSYAVAGWNQGALLLRTVTLSLGVTVVALPFGLVLVAISRWRNSVSLRVAARLLGLGYALPGAVLAVGVVSVSGLVATYFEFDGDGWFSFILPGSLAVLVIAYLSRFMVLVLGTLDSALKKVRKPLTETALVLGQGRTEVLRRIYIPLILPALAVAALLIFVETMREMPMTLLLRPMGWTTMAVQIFTYSTEGEWQGAAVPALILVLLGLVPVFLAMRRQYPVRRRSD